MRIVAVAGVVLAALAGGASVLAGRGAPAAGWLSFGNGPTRAGVTAAAVDPSAVRASWYRDTDGVDTTQPLVARNVPSAGQTTVYVATNLGRLIASAPNGYIRWQRNLGVAPNSCPQLDSYGITGTPVVDPGTHAIYAVDAFGLLHALDLTTGRERAGWPVQIYSDPSEELDWGALTDVRGSIYAGTGSFCDRPMEAKLIRVELANRRVTTLTLVPRSLGGGGGIWGWGGVAYSAKRDSIFAVTGNAFEGGTNVDSAFSESAGYGEQLLQLTRDLRVVAADHPSSVTGVGDFDFVGSPIVFTPRGCDEVVAAVNKNGHFYIWKSGAISQGPIADLVVQPPAVRQPLLSQPAFDAATSSVFVVTSSALVKVTMDGCGAKIAWEQPLAVVTLNGSPTVAGGTVWLVAAGSSATLRGYDTISGRLRYEHRIGQMSFTPPVVSGGRIFVGADHGFASLHPTPSRPQLKASALRSYTSWSDARHGWQSRETGVYATDDGGKTWRRVYRMYAQRVLRVSAQRGVISIGPAGGCECTQRQLYTGDGGRTWHVTRALSKRFAGQGAAIYTWSGDVVSRASWPPAHATRMMSFAHEVADVAPVPGGFVALLTTVGQSYDTPAHITVFVNDLARTLALPEVAGRVLARTVTVRWPSIVVRGYLFTANGRRTILWTSGNGGASWRLS